MEDVIIIGAGLTGLAISYQLKKSNISSKILEAQNRLGGRIETVRGKQNTPMEMGATWFSKEHQNLQDLLNELNLGYFEQFNSGISLYETIPNAPPQQYFVPPNTHSAYRIQGGTYSIIEALAKCIGEENIILNTPIIKVTDEGDCIEITDSVQNTFQSKHLIIVMPPKTVTGIQFSPALPEALNQIMQLTQTWMSGSIKFAVEYQKVFWKDKGLSGTVFSQSGLVAEMYDHSNFEETRFALKGFLNGSAVSYTFEERKAKVIAQLKNYFGQQAEDFVSYHDKVWNDQYIQPTNDTLLPPHFNNGHVLYAQSYMNNKLFFTGTETSTLFSGYMEGAIIAANSVADKVSALLRK